MAAARRLRPFGELEAAIMERLWDAGAERSVREIVDALRVRRPLAYTTVMTVLDNLFHKGWVTRERDGRAWRYLAAVSRQEYAAALMNDALATTSDRAGALAKFAEEIDADDAEVLAQALACALAQRRREAGR
ncbi:BlaI/MecI/CopY family transcriptional regulator [Kribbella sp. GL6]|uniref:BlaI/MecI/CopY family transcriptional regulator n=1 Tax=Kribbella sp. GL6 TaxID=3419765 RepID=UPI003D0799A1